jgi:Tol biopolymer transport system component
MFTDFEGHVATINADGTDRNLVLDLPVVGMSVCPQGDRVLLVMLNKETTGVNIYRMNTAGGRPSVVTSGKLDQNVSCSPDGKFFVYTSMINGKQLPMRMAIEGGQARQLSDEFVLSAAVSPDGQQVALMTVEGQGVQIKGVIKVIPSSGGAPLKSVPVLESVSGGMQFSADGKAVYYPVREKGVSNLVKQSLDGGAPTPATDFKELTSYGFAYNWPANKLAITRGKLNSDVVVITQQASAQ